MGLTAMRLLALPVEFTADFNGKVYRATYTIEKVCITFAYWTLHGEGRVMTTQLGGHAAAPEVLGAPAPFRDARQTVEVPPGAEARF